MVENTQLVNPSNWNCVISRETFAFKFYWKPWDLVLLFVRSSFSYSLSAVLGEWYPTIRNHCIIHHLHIPVQVPKINQPYCCVFFGKLSRIKVNQIIVVDSLCKVARSSCNLYGKNFRHPMPRYVLRFALQSGIVEFPLSCCKFSENNVSTLNWQD